MTNAIAVHDLRKSYDKVEAVCGIDFTVAEGEVVALLGPNGAGKTTTIEILEGFRQRTSGDVRVLGIDPADGGSDFRQRLGIVLQSCGIDPVPHGQRSHPDAPRLLPAPTRRRRGHRARGSHRKARHRVKLLSGGQQRRLDVALGLIGDPDLLFLDEPTTGFDPSARRQAWEIVRNLRSLGKTVLLTTHYMDEAQNLADRVIVIARARSSPKVHPKPSAGELRSATSHRVRRAPGGDSACVAATSTPVDCHRVSPRSATGVSNSRPTTRHATFIGSPLGPRRRASSSRD